MTYNPSNPPSNLPPDLQRYLVQELRRISTEIGQIEAGEPGPGPGDVFWGDIDGQIADQLDLQAELDGKAQLVHQHQASDTTSGTFLDARIPNLNASKTTAGRFTPQRFILAQGNVDWAGGSANISNNFGVNSVNPVSAGILDITLNSNNPNFLNQRLVLITPTVSLVSQGALMTSGTVIRITSTNVVSDAFQDSPFSFAVWDQ